MGVSDRLAAWSLQRVHVLAVEVPGWWTTRAALEARVVACGWAVATSPADADVLVVCGDAGAQLGERVELVWDQLPSPRARAAVNAPMDVGAALDRVAAELADVRAQRSSAASRMATSSSDAMDQGDMEGMDDGDMEGMDHGDMEGMDHGDMDMAPSGIPLASGAPDRDGLEMDVLQVPLGPVLAHWPAGLVLRCTLAGDIVTGADVEVLRGAGLPPEAGPAPATLRAARCLDAASSVLALAGWTDASAQAQQLRDRLLADPAPDMPTVVPAIEALRNRVARSLALRWMLRGVRPSSGALAAGPDVHGRLLGLLDDARGHLNGTADATTQHPTDVLEALPDAVTGLDIAAVRLVVAALDVRTDRLPAEAVLHG
ncbi:MAG TPA: hypothetical protein VHO29_19660 [Marmoricola sp.]|nr:hypothetical protein [Marmoricola sp.]